MLTLRCKDSVPVILLISSLGIPTIFCLVGCLFCFDLIFSYFFILVSLYLMLYIWCCSVMIRLVFSSSFKYLFLLVLQVFLVFLLLLVLLVLSSLSCLSSLFSSSWSCSVARIKVIILLLLFLCARTVCSCKSAFLLGLILLLIHAMVVICVTVQDAELPSASFLRAIYW